MNEQLFHYLQALLFAIAAHRDTPRAAGLLHALELLHNTVMGHPIETAVDRETLLKWAEYHASGTVGEAIAAGLLMECGGLTV